MKKRFLVFFILSLFLFSTAFAQQQPATSHGHGEAAHSVPPSVEHKPEDAAPKLPNPGEKKPGSPSPAFPTPGSPGPGLPKRPRPSFENTINYRGSRVYADKGPLLLTYTRPVRLNEKTVMLEIAFNQAINPRSVKKSSICIDNQELPADIDFYFNKKGDSLRVEVPLEKDNFVIKIQGIRSFDGKQMESVELITTITQEEES